MAAGNEPPAMDIQRRYGRTILLVAVAALGHGLLTWPVGRTLALFVGGAAIAFAAEVVGVQWGLVEHHLEPKVLGVPVLVIVAWPATVYIALRVALLVVPLGVGAAALSAVLATLTDIFLDPKGVEDRAWRYPRVPLSSARYKDVPYWNFGAWLVITFLTALLPAVAG